MLDEALIAFLQQGLAINLGTRNAQLEPHAAHVSAVRVDADRHHLVLYVPRVAAKAVLADLHANGQAAVVFARPADDRACQVKGTFVSDRRARATEREAVTAQWRGFVRQLETVGWPGEASRPWVFWPCVAIRLRVHAVFSQTPGPDAGAPLA